MTLIGLVLGLAIIGLVVWLIVTYIPMPAVVRTAILVITAIVVIVYLLQVLGVGTILVPRLR